MGWPDRLVASRWLGTWLGCCRLVRLGWSHFSAAWLSASGRRMRTLPSNEPLLGADIVSKGRACMLCDAVLGIIVFVQYDRRLSSLAYLQNFNLWFLSGQCDGPGTLGSS